MSKTIKLPKNLEDFKSALKHGIQRYIGSPVNNNNKLNESAAVALDFKNQDVLSAALLHIDPVKYEIDFDYKDDTLINDIQINEDVERENLAPFRVRERTEFIQSILDVISEQRGKKSRKYMEETLEVLYKTDDEFVLESIETNQVLTLSENEELFNKACEEILSAHYKLEKEEEEED